MVAGRRRGALPVEGLLPLGLSLRPVGHRTGHRRRDALSADPRGRWSIHRCRPPSGWRQRHRCARHRHGRSAAIGDDRRTALRHPARRERSGHPGSGALLWGPELLDRARSGAVDPAATDGTDSRTIAVAREQNVAPVRCAPPLWILAFPPRRRQRALCTLSMLRDDAGFSARNGGETRSSEATGSGSRRECVLDVCQDAECRAGRGRWAVGSRPPAGGSHECHPWKKRLNRCD